MFSKITLASSFLSPTSTFSYAFAPESPGTFNTNDVAGKTAKVIANSITCLFSPTKALQSAFSSRDILHIRCAIHLHIRYAIHLKADINAPNNRGRTALHIAARERLVDMVTRLLNLGEGIKVAEINAADDNGATALHIAVWLGYTDVVAVLLNPGEDIQGADINAADIGGGTVLHIAAREGHADVVAMLLNPGEGIQGAIINATSDGGKTALHCAAQAGNANVVARLLNPGEGIQGANINATDRGGRTALHYAAEERHADADLVAMLLNPEGGIDINAPDNNGATALHIAAQHRYTDMVAMLLNPGGGIQGADINATDNNGATALHIAAGKRRTDVVAVLLNPGEGIQGANINATDRGGKTALHIAAQHGYTHMIAMLLNPGEGIQGANINATDRGGKTALHCAMDGERYRVQSGHLLSFIILCVVGKAEIRAQDADGETPLGLANVYLDKRRLPPVRISSERVLLRELAGCIEEEEIRRQALQLVSDGSLESFAALRTADLLLSSASSERLSLFGILQDEKSSEGICFAIIDALPTHRITGEDGNTLLKIASEKGLYEVVMNLLSRGANNDLAMENEETYQNFSEKVRLCLGVSLNPVNTALVDACDKGWYDIAEFLLMSEARNSITSKGIDDTFQDLTQEALKILSENETLGDHNVTLRNLLIRSLLLENFPIKEGSSALIDAYENEFFDIVRSLLFKTSWEALPTEKKDDGIKEALSEFFNQIRLPKNLPVDNERSAVVLVIKEALNTREDSISEMLKDHLEGILELFDPEAGASAS
ncbi:MAG: Phosphocholine transferase AnkX [Chlamydiae bacterium]|nr:Phosphocholine transferase AnkX [Chlamydiota bacterium]